MVCASGPESQSGTGGAMKKAEIPGGATIWARKTIDDEIFYLKPDPWFKIWFYLVNKANHRDSERFKRGTCFVQYRVICEAVGTNIDVVKKCMAWLRRKGSISTSRSTRGANVIINKYDYYQTLDNYEYRSKAPDKAPDKLPKKHQKSTEETPGKLSDRQEYKNVENDKNGKNEKNSKVGSSFGPSGRIDIFDPVNGVTSFGAEDGRINKTSPGAHLNKAIILFKQIFPGEFAGNKNVLSNQTTRDVVEAMLERYTFNDLDEIIHIYDGFKNDMYSPRAKTIYDFCTKKLASIERHAYLNGGDRAGWVHVPDEYNVREKMSKEEKRQFDVRFKRDLHRLENRPWGTDI